MAAIQCPDNIHIVDYLLGRPDIEPDCRDANGWTALMVAVAAGNKPAVEKLLRRPDVDVNARSVSGQTALMLAANRNESEIARRLLEEPSIMLDLEDEEGRTALSYSLHEEHSDIALDILDMKPKNVNTRYMDLTPLMVASEKGYGGVVEILLRHPGIELNPTARVCPKTAGTMYWGLDGLQDMTALCIALDHGRMDVVDKILANKHVELDQGTLRPLTLASVRGDEEMVKKLLATGRVDVNYISLGSSALVAALRRGHMGVVKVLLTAKGIDTDIEAQLADENRMRALSLSREGRQKLVDRLGSVLRT